MKRAAALAFLAMVLSACSEPLEFADWTIPVPEGVRIVEYDHVPIEERTERIDLVEDLAIGGVGDDPRYSFYRPRGIAVDDEGRIYVADYGDHQVKVFDDTGAHLRSLGREGQGPGEFVGPGHLTIAGSLLVANNNARLSFWDLDGEHIGSAVTGANTPWTMAGLDDGTLIVRYLARDDDGRQLSAFARWDIEGRELTRYPSLRDPLATYYPSRDAEGRIGLSVGPAIPAFAASREGPIYLTQSDQYQVLAFDPEGTMVWALRVAYRNPPLSREEIDRAMDLVQRRFPGAKEGAIEWPDTEPALTKILVDGHGHLYVFPYVAAGFEPDERQVDVYSADGRRLFTGWIPSKIWLWADRFVTHGDFLYDVRENDETAENEVVRFRLVEPFE